jgi:phage terminase small subunit
MTDKQQRFVDEYLVDLNATQAAIRAGYSKKTAGAQGHDLLKKIEIQNAVRAAMDARSDKVLADPYWAMSELKDLYREARAQGSKGHTAAARTLEMVFRRMGLFTDNVNQTGPLTVTIIKPDRTKRTH